MKRRLTLAIAALAAFGLLAGFATNASAHPNKTSACTSCHGTATAVAISATPVAGTNNGTTVQYQIKLTGGLGYAVFKGTAATGIYASSTSGVVTLNVATAYTIWAVNPADGATKINITTPAGAVVTPPADTVAPVTTSDALATYVSSAAIHLSATDNAGGSGVAATYYVLDGGSQTAGTLVTAATVGDHTLSFWSVDVAGNIEAAHLVSFAVTAPDPVVPPVIDPTPTPTPTPDPTPTPAPDPSAMCRLTIHIMGINGHVAKSVKVTLVDTVTGATFTLRTNKSGNASFANVPYGTYTVTAGNSKIAATRTLTIGKSRVKLNLKLHRVHAHQND